MFKKLLFTAAAVAFAIDPAPDGDENSSSVLSDENKAAITDSGEKHEFQAEVSRLMDIIINSLYTDKQIFLRELISNAADALEKCRFHSVQDSSFLGDRKDLEIKLDYDPDNKTLTIIDSGVGMTKADLINNLGTVAKSGTTNFLEAMAEGGDANLIGQFGVGFYSAFLVADKITVASKNNDDDVQHIWESSADASFTLAEDPRGNTLGRGTAVMLHLKEDAQEFLEESKLKELATKFSQFIQYPIYVKTKKEVEAEPEEDDDSDEDEDEDKKDDVETKDEDKEDKEDGDKEEEKKEKKEKKEKAPVKKTVYDWEQVNTQKAIWLRSKDEVTEAEYNEFYKAIAKDYLEPLANTHFSAEGEIDFKSVLFVPKKASPDMMDNYWTKKSEVKLYVRRVLVAEKFEELLPRYLNFIKGVVDSDDLPLNVSREQLQQNKIMKVITKKLVRKVLELLKKMAKDDKDDVEDDEDDEERADDGEEKEPEEKKKKDDEESTYDKFWKEFAKNIKMGCYEDDSNRSKISKLLRFPTTKSDGKPISLDKYLDGMSEKQESIYYMSGDSLDVMLKSPSLQRFKKADIEVFLFADHLDEPCIQKMADYEGKKFASIQKADVKIEENDDEKKRHKKLEAMYADLSKWWKDLLTELTDNGAMKQSGIKMDSVVVSKRLVDSPVVVVTSQFGYSAHQEKIMRAQAFQNKDQIQMMAGRKTLEINPNHPIIVNLRSKVMENPEDPKAEETAQVLFQTALIESGYEISDPSDLARRMYKMMSSAMGVDPDEPMKDVEVPEDEEEDEKEEEEADDDKEKEEVEEEAGEDTPPVAEEEAPAAEEEAPAAEEEKKAEL